MKIVNQCAPSAAIILLAIAISGAAQSPPVGAPLPTPPSMAGPFASAPLPPSLENCVECSASLSGSQSASGEVDSNGVRNNVVFTGTTAGTLPGTFSAAINYRTDDNSIVGGAWVLIIGEGDNHEIGRLTGRVSEGTVTLNPDGAIASVTAKVEIGNGTKKYTLVHSGNGTLSLTLEQGEALLQIVAAQSVLKLSF